MSKTTISWISANWERVLFALVGFVLLGTCLKFIWVERITEAAVAFGIGFLCFIYSNVARFKRFKGLGFEAELWEDKQREAADLIERLREVVSIYTREVVLGKVTAGRWGSAGNWADRWKLYDDLVTQHNALGQKIDFSKLKKEIDDYFLFDITIPETNKITEAINTGRAGAQEKIKKEFGPVIQDIEGHSRRYEQFHAIESTVEDAFEISKSDDLAGLVLRLLSGARNRLKSDFDIVLEVDSQTSERLSQISKLYQSRPVKVTDELIRWADREG